MTDQALETKTVFVKNIPYMSTEEDLKPIFGVFGNVASVRILKERIRGNIFSRGIGFVEFEDEASFQKCIAAKDNELQCGNRQLHYQQARAKAPRKDDTIFVSSIPEGTTVDELKECFASFDPVDARIHFFNKEGRPGYGFVKFASAEKRTAVVQNTTVQLKGQESTVRPARKDFDAPRRTQRRRFRQYRRAPKTTQ